VVKKLAVASTAGKPERALILMVGYIFPTYAGYETITQLSEEVKTAGKTIPRALFLSLAITTVIFTGTAMATRALPSYCKRL